MKEFLSERPWIYALILVFALAFPGFLRVEYINSKIDDRVHCIQDWADATARRSTILTEENNKRVDALDALLVAAIERNQAVIPQKTKEFVDAAKRYKEFVKNNPVPVSPKLSCIQ